MTITELNDALRTTFSGGRVMLTAAVGALPEATKAAVLDKVKSFDAFTPDNDAYVEHDFGAFDFGGERILFKIDYYAPDLEHGAENPADPATTVRVLTIMLAADY